MNKNVSKNKTIKIHMDTIQLNEYINRNQKEPEVEVINIGYFIRRQKRVLPTKTISYLRRLNKRRKTVSGVIILSIISFIVNIIAFVLIFIFFHHKVEAKCETDSDALNNAMFFLAEQHKFCICHYPYEQITGK